MKYYIIAGEASGDLHGSNLMKALKERDNNAEFRCWGGDLMKEQGGTLVKHIRELAFMGIIEVVLNVRTIFKNLKICKEDIIRWEPDVIVMVDYPGFNLKIAKFAKKNNLRVFYYISPKIWAWKTSRIKIIKECVERMFVILPFEVEFYKNHNFNVDYVGNPILDAIEAGKKSLSSAEDFRKENGLDEKPIIALLAGSRKHEIDKCLPEMLPLISQYPEFQFVLAAAPSIDQSFYKSIIKDEKIILLYGKTYDILNNACAAVVTSGTATLETALFSVPQVVIYKILMLTYIIGKPFVHIRFFSLVNLIMDKEVVKELLQFKLAKKIKKELDKILYDTDYRNNMLENIDVLKKKMGPAGVSVKTANLMLRYLKPDEFKI